MLDWTRDHGGIVGPGRGSAVGSVVNYCLDITDIEPLKYGLLFERFLNPERIQLPDIDTDFDSKGLDAVTSHLAMKYGREKVSHVISFGELDAKRAFELTAWAYGVPPGKAARITEKLGWRSLEIELKHNHALEHEYKIGTPRMQEAYQTAMILEGVFYKKGVHACANLVSAFPLEDCLPMIPYHLSYLSKKGSTIVPISQYTVRWVEDAGVLKIDNLGLLTLDEIRETKAAVEKRYGIHLDLNSIPLDDEGTLKIYQNGDTEKIFQFDYDGMRDWLSRLHPDSFDQLVAMEALYQPGTMENLPEYVYYKNSADIRKYSSPELVPILKETYGILLYQEQAMLMLQKYGGFTPGQAAKAGRFLGAHESVKYDQFCAYMDAFMYGGRKLGYSEETLEDIWKQLDIEGRYAAIKSHAVAYTWLSYQTAWLKAHYREEFEAAVEKVWSRFNS